MLFICPEEGGVVFEAALGVDLGWLHPGGNPFLGKEQSLDGDILPDGCAGGLFEDSKKMGLADVKPLG